MNTQSMTPSRDAQAALPVTSELDVMTQRSRAWWLQTRDSPCRFALWLKKQLHGERTAASRILLLRDTWLAGAAEVGRPRSPAGRAHRLLSVIAAQEQQHAEWVEGLLRSRALHLPADDHIDRYWQRTLSEAPPVSFAEACAIGALAEQMRLLRIQAIVCDPAAPSDVHDCFARILVQERFHARAFASLAGDQAIAGRWDAHRRGARWLGLLP
jgi:hypothetical protein